MATSGATTITIELSVAGDRLAGRLLSERLGSRSFDGWLELAGLIDAARVTSVAGPEATAGPSVATRTRPSVAEPGLHLPMGRPEDVGT